MRKQIGITTIIVAASAFALVPAIGAQFTQPFALFAQAVTPDKVADSKAVVDDREITLRVRAALGKDKEIAALSLSVKATEGTVVLTGSASNRAQADRAVDIARAVPGVKSVQSDIRVS